MANALAHNNEGDWGDTRMGFGKYENLTYFEVASQHPEYADWALSVIEPGGPLQDFRSFLETGFDYEGSIITFGRYAGRSYRYVARNHPEYLDWARRQEQPSVALQHLIDWADQHYQPHEIERRHDLFF